MPQVQGSPPELEAQQARLVDAAVASGGWPYYPGKAPRLEPTAWALLALSPWSTSPAVERAASRAIDWLASLPRDDGLLVEPSAPGLNYGWNGLTLLALTSGAARPPSAVTAPMVDGLLAARGIAIDSGPTAVRLDGSLQAWSWTEGTFSWVEPTAYCLLALKKAGVARGNVASRITDGEAVLFDRVCAAGGWNYGNSEVLSQDLRPYVPTTALALLALQDKPGHPAVTRSLEWLLSHALSERSTMALALAAVCLRVFRQPAGSVLDLLTEQEARSALLGNVHLSAMALYARSLDRHEARAVALS